MQADAIDAEMRRRGAGLAFSSGALASEAVSPPTSPDKL